MPIRRPLLTIDPGPGLRVELLADLQAVLRPDQVSTAGEERLRHAGDVWSIHVKVASQGRPMGVPAAVVWPEVTRDVQEVVRWAERHQIPLVPYGAGSNVVGCIAPTAQSIVVDLGRLNRILGLDEESLLVRVEAGVIGSHLEAFLNARGYTLGHSPQSLDCSTVGGWIATRSTGHFSSLYGGIEDIISALTWVLPFGSVWEMQPSPRPAFGPDLRQLVIGAEGTLGIVTEAVLRIWRQPETRRLGGYLFQSVGDGLGAMREIMQARLQPMLLRLYDRAESARFESPERREGMLLVTGSEGLEGLVSAEVDAIGTICRRWGGVALGPGPVEEWWERRFDYSWIEQHLFSSGGVAETIEVGHTWSRIEDAYNAISRRLRAVVDEVYGHFSHAYPDGCSIYFIAIGRRSDDAAAEATIREVWQSAMAGCGETGAAIAHHHGIGRARLPWLERELGVGMHVLRRIRGALDPLEIMSPGNLGGSTGDRGRR